MKEYINKSKILKDSSEWIKIGKEEKDINFLIEENTCIVCESKWISVFINDIVVYGGSASFQNKGIFIKPICTDCINIFGKNSPAQKFIDLKLKESEVKK